LILVSGFGLRISHHDTTYFKGPQPWLTFPSTTFWALPIFAGSSRARSAAFPIRFRRRFSRSIKPSTAIPANTRSYSGTRTNATISPYGAPSKNRQLRDIGVKSVKLLHSIENIVLPVKDYVNLLNYNDLAKQKLGIDEVSRQIREARWTQDNLRISALTSMLFKTQIYYDGVGNLLPSATGAQTTVNYNVPAGIRISLTCSARGIS
jgi:hypothetical protein